MGLIYLAAYKGKGKLFNRLIRLWTRSHYSHCELVMPDGRWLSASAMDGGVRTKRIAFNAEHWDLIPVAWADSKRIEQVFTHHFGKGYDWLGILLSQFLPIGIDSRQRMFCSEFCAAALGFHDVAARFSPVLLCETVRSINRLSASPLKQDLRNAADA